MKALALTAALLLAASPALADSGRIVCENELRDLVRALDARQLSDETRDQVEVLAAQCRFDSARAEASMAGMRGSLGLAATPQTAYQPDFLEWADAID